MASKVAICNMALQRVSADRITSLTDGTESANACNAIYDIVADEVMVEAGWTTAVRRSTLAQTATTPDFGFTYEYQLPVDPKCLLVLDVYSLSSIPIEYRIEGDKLLTDEIEVSIRYVGRITSPDAYGPFLTRAIVSRLAMELAYKNAGSLGMRQQLRDEYMSDLAEAISGDGTQGTPDEIFPDKYIRDR